MRRTFRYVLGTVGRWAAVSAALSAILFVPACPASGRKPFDRGGGSQIRREARAYDGAGRIQQQHRLIGTIVRLALPGDASGHAGAKRKRWDALTTDPHGGR